MKRFLIQNVTTGRYFLQPHNGTTKHKEEAHTYTQETVDKYPHLVRSLSNGRTHKVPVDAKP